MGRHPYDVSSPCSRPDRQATRRLTDSPSVITRGGYFYGCVDLNWGTRIVPVRFAPSCEDSAQSSCRLDYPRLLRTVEDGDSRLPCYWRRTGPVRRAGRAFNFSNEIHITVPPTCGRI